MKHILKGYRKNWTFRINSKKHCWERKKNQLQKKLQIGISYILMPKYPFQTLARESTILRQKKGAEAWNCKFYFFAKV